MPNQKLFLRQKMWEFVLSLKAVSNPVILRTENILRLFFPKLQILHEHALINCYSICNWKIAICLFLTFTTSLPSKKCQNRSERDN